MSNEISVSINVMETKQKIIEAATEELEKHLTQIAKSTVHSDYTLGIFIRDHINSYIKQNLKSLVTKELESVNIKDKVDKAVERAVLDLVRQQLKNINPG